MADKNEIKELKSMITSLRAEVEALKLQVGKSNSMINAIKEGTFELAISLTHAHEKANLLLLQSPEISQDILSIENILGPANAPTPNAPRFS